MVHPRNLTAAQAKAMVSPKAIAERVAKEQLQQIKKQANRSYMETVTARRADPSIKSEVMRKAQRSNVAVQDILKKTETMLADPSYTMKQKADYASYQAGMAKASSVGGIAQAKSRRAGVSAGISQKESYTADQITNSPIDKFAQGFTVATKDKGFTPTNVSPRRGKIQTEAQQAAKAQAAFTTTRQKIEAGRAAKAQALAEVKATATSKSQIIGLDAQSITRMISPREQAEAISRGEIPQQEIGPLSTQKILESTTSGEFAKKPESGKTIIGTPKGPQAAMIVGGLVGSQTFFTLEKDDGKRPIPPEQKGLLQDYPRSYKVEDITLGGIARGFYEGGIKPLAEVILAPKPIFTDIAGPTAEDLAFRKKIITKTKEFIKPGPTLTGSIIEQVSSGQPIRGTGEGLSYDIGSGAFDIALIIAPTKKIPVPLKVGRIGSDKIIVVGAGSYLKPIATITGSKITRGYDITKIGEVGFKKIADSFNIKAKGGAELDALGNVESRIITSSKNLRKLEQAGIFSKEDVKLIEAGKVGVKESAKLPEKTFRDLGPQPFEKIKPGKETIAIKEFFKSEKITLEGSAIDIPTFSKKFVGRAGDFDVKAKSFIKSQEMAKKAAVRLTTAAEGTGREFRAIGAKVEGFYKGKSFGKVGEFLAPDDPEAIGQIAKTGKVFGVKTTTKTMKVEGIKMRTGKFQINRRIASITSLQSITGGGVRISPPMNVPGVGAQRAKDFPRAYAGLMTRAEVAIGKGQFARAGRLSRAAKDIRKVGEKYIDFDKFFAARKYGTMKLVQKEKGGLKISSSLLEKSSPVTIETASQIGSSSSQSLVSEILSVKKSPPSPLRGTSSITSKSIINKSLLSSPKSTIKSPSISKISSSKSTISKILGSPKSAIKSPSISKISSSKSTISKISGSPKSAISTVSKSSIASSPGLSGLGSPASPSGKGSPTGKPSAPKGPSRASISKAGPSTRSIISTERKRKPAIIPIWKSRIDKPYKEEERYRKPFLGNVHQEEITGFRTRETDIDYGKMVAKYARKDIQFTRKKKKMKKFVKDTKVNLLSKPSRYFTPTKEQSKQMMRL